MYFLVALCKYNENAVIIIDLVICCTVLPPPFTQLALNNKIMCFMS